MLPITVPATELYDENTEEFFTIPETHLQLEHSLLSLKKWESKWHIPFYDGHQRTTEQTLDYIRCMTLTQNVNLLVYQALSPQNYEDINAYIDDPMTATWFGSDAEKKPKSNKTLNKQIITAERIYYWMCMYHIPFECQKWHLNQLITLIRVCNEESNPKKPLKGKAMYNRRRELNEARKKQLHTKG